MQISVINNKNSDCLHFLLTNWQCNTEWIGLPLFSSYGVVMGSYIDIDHKPYRPQMKTAISYTTSATCDVDTGHTEIVLTFNLLNIQPRISHT